MRLDYDFATSKLNLAAQAIGPSYVQGKLAAAAWSVIGPHTDTNITTREYVFLGIHMD
jgi:hypothetical protein